MMFWTKAKIAITTAAAVLFVAGGATVIPRAFAQQAANGVINLTGPNTSGMTFSPASGVVVATTTQPSGEAATEPSEASDGPFEFEMNSGDMMNLELPSAMKFDFRAPSGADQNTVRNVYTVNGAKTKEVERLTGADFGFNTSIMLSMTTGGRPMNNMGIEFTLDAYNGDSLAPVDSENWTNPDAQFLNSAMSLWTKNNPTPPGADHMPIQIDTQAVLPLTYVCRSTQGHLFLIQFTKFTKSQHEPDPDGYGGYQASAGEISIPYAARTGVFSTDTRSSASAAVRA